MGLVSEVWCRIRCAWHVLRGRPLIWRTKFETGIELEADQEHLMVIGNSVNARGGMPIIWGPFQG